MAITSHPRVSARTLWLNGAFRVMRHIADIVPIRAASMSAVNMVLALPIVVLTRGVTVETHTAGNLRIDTIVHRDVAQPECTILHIHGGGFVFGSTRTHRLLATELSRHCRSRVVLFDYRLLPEHSAQAALDDCLAAYLWARTTYPSAPLIVSGDSAGGNLMVSLLSRLENEELPMPLGAIGMSAWLDPDYVHEPAAARDSFFSLRFADRASRLAESTHIIRPLAGRLPHTPMMLQCGADEPLRPSNELLIERLTAAGVTAELHVWQKQSHVFQALAPHLPEAVQALETLAAFISALADPKPT